MAIELNMLKMTVPERELWTATREFVDKVQPNLDSSDREKTIMAIYKNMHFVTKTKNP